MRVHAIASLAHYERHIRAVWEHLPDDLRGVFLTGPQVTGVQLPERDVVMVAGWNDVNRGRSRQRIIYVEHGSGQSYLGSPESVGNRGYHGTDSHPQTVMGYISPRQDVADSWGRPAFAAGCPALDRWAGAAPNDAPTVAITFHWPATFSPEAGSALEHYRQFLPAIVADLRSQGFAVIGHWHPRRPTMRAMWRELGVETVGDLDEVFQRCHLLIADNTSAMYELAALGRPVIALNCPQYRRDVHHGLRFWNHVPGMQVDSPDELLGLDLAGYIDDDPSAELRTAAVRYCYALEPGHAGEAAARWIAELVG